MRVIALVATYNEERFIGGCIDHLARQGVETYLLDDSSTDRTVEIAERYRGRGLVDIEKYQRPGFFSLVEQCRRKEELAATLDADWFIHIDADEIRLPPHSGTTLQQALAEADAQGYNAVNFMEFAFVPTLEAPDHDHPDFQKTMRWYYPMLPSFPHRLNAWKRQSRRVDLASSGGHVIKFPKLKMYPKSFPMRHYLFLSIPHAREKFLGRKYDPEEVKKGWHRWRSRLTREMLKLPSEKELRVYVSDDQLDPSEPRKRHYLAEIWAAAQQRKENEHAA
jgi:glycosyltransferase involved in cell wall biosynthesis